MIYFTLPTQNSQHMWRRGHHARLPFKLGDSGSIINILAGRSPGLDAPRVAGSFPNSPSDSPNLQVCLVFITCHFGKKY